MDKATVVDALCANLQIPGVGESIERAAVTRAVSGIYDHVPVFVWGIVVTAADGLDSGEIDALLESVSKTVAARVKMPYLPESVRKQLVDQLLDLLRSSLKFDQYIEALAK
jgi:hypothetical protein